MKYFQNLPKVFDVDDRGKYLLVTNIMARVNIIPSLLKDLSLYYEYDIQDEDTPEIVASKYYGSSENYWLVMFSNQALDPQWDWPLSNRIFEKYIENKYGSTATALSTLDHYEKTVTTRNSLTNESYQETFVIDETEYNEPTTDETITITQGNLTSTITISTEKRAISKYEKERLANEKKRNIKLLDKRYYDLVVVQFKKLMEK